MTDRNEKLGIIVEATDHASGKLGAVKREIAGIGGAAQRANMGGFFSGIERGATRMKSAIGGAVSHAKRQLSSLATFGMATLGVGGILGIGAVVSSSVREASEFGAAVAKVSKLTGLAVPVASSMVDTLDKWGLSGDKLGTVLGRLQKNVYGLTDGSKAAAKFHDQFGVSLVDAKGKALDANAVLLKSADYFNSTATASQKAAFLQKLYGKTWTDLVPILSKGSKAIQAEEKNSIKLTQTQLDNITKYRTASRDFQDVLGDVKVKIGAEIMPLLTGALTATSAWLDTHGDEVAGFFRDAGTFAGTAIGTIAGVFSTLKAGWDSIPEPLRNMILTGLVADRTVKFLFGFSPIQLVAGIGKDIVGGVAGGLGNALVRAGIGKAFVQPVFVTNAGFGAGGAGGAGAAGGAAAGGGLANKVVTAAGGLLIFDQLMHLPGELGGLGAAFDGLTKNDLPAARKGFQDFVNAMPDIQNPFGPNKEMLKRLFEGKTGERVVQRVALTERQEAILAHQASTMDALERNRIRATTNVSVKSTTNVRVNVSARSVATGIKSQNTFASSTNTNRTGGAVDAGDLY